jgi:hypothetical protein
MTKPWKEHCEIIRARQTRDKIMPMLDTHPWKGDNIMALATIWYKARTCQEQGTCMTRAWPYHCNNMAKAWQDHCKNMATRPWWQDYGKSMVRTWQEHGKPMLVQ